MPDSRDLPADLHGWLNYLEQLHSKSIALGLDRIGVVARKLGLVPDFPIITVGGTNGKGSTCAMLERIYREAGYRTASYSSPHLLRYNERVRIGGVEVSDVDLCRAFAAVEAARGNVPLTYFEFGTLAAMWHFIGAQVDIAILEVGLGGRLDAVNIFEPDCTIITSVDLDHQEFLGPDRESIGREKAGIFRTGIPALCGEPDAPSSVQGYARAIGADFRQIGVDYGFERTHDGWQCYVGSWRLAALPEPALFGSFQLGNAACAVAAVHLLQHLCPVPESAIRAGLRAVELNGRFQRVATHPEVILDVAHNPHAARAFAENLRRQPAAEKTIAVFAMLADKDIIGVVRALASVVDIWCVAGIVHPRGAQADHVMSILQAEIPGGRFTAFRDVESAYHHACEMAGENDRIIVFGSFYTVADVLHALKGDGWQAFS